MKILCSRFAQETGGAEKSYFAHLKAFSELGHEVFAFTNLDMPQGLTVRNQDAWWFRRHSKPYKLLVFGPQIVQGLVMVWRFKPDVINPHSRFDQILFSLTKPLHRRPLVWKDPLEIGQHLGEDRPRLSRLIYIFALRRADAIYVLSEDQRGNLIKKLPEDVDTDKIRLIYSGIDFSRYDLGAKPLVESDSIVVGYAARLHKAKGIQYLIAAFAIAKKSVPNLKLVVMGSGSDLPRLKSLAGKLKVTSSVEFIPYQEDVSSFLNSLNIYACPSLYESWGLAVHEARLFGLPIIATDIGSLPEQIKDGRNGLLVPPANAQALADAIIKLANEKELAKTLGENARKSALELGDFSKTVEQKLIPLFEEVHK